MATASPGTGGNIQQLRAANMAARQFITQAAIDLIMPIISTTATWTSGSPTVINVPVRPVGLVKRFWIEVIGTLNAASGHSLTSTPTGLANLFSSLVLTDLSNQTRISTAGWHLHYLATVRRQLAFGAAFTNSDTSGIANNWNTGTPNFFMQTPATVTGGTPLTARWFYEVPVTYSDNDLTGGIWANTINAAANVQFTINPNLAVASGADGALAAYTADAALGTTLPTFTSITYTVYQNALDQLPVNPQTNNVVLPILDLEYAYLILNTNVAALTANADQAIPFANWRSFLSTFLYFDNFGYNTAPIGSDVNKISLQTANFTNTFQMDPFMVALLTRTKINDDLPAKQGATFGHTLYYIDTRNKPVNTVQYGNMQLLFNPAVVQSASSVLYVGYEALALQGAMQQAGSLYQV